VLKAGPNDEVRRPWGRGARPHAAGGPERRSRGRAGAAQLLLNGVDAGGECAPSGTPLHGRGPSTKLSTSPSKQPCLGPTHPGPTHRRPAGHHRGAQASTPSTARHDSDARQRATSLLSRPTTSCLHETAGVPAPPSVALRDTRTSAALGGPIAGRCSTSGTCPHPRCHYCLLPSSKTHPPWGAAGWSQLLDGARRPARGRRGRAPGCQRCRGRGRALRAPAWRPWRCRRCRSRHAAAAWRWEAAGASLAATPEARAAVAGTAERPRPRPRAILPSASPRRATPLHQAWSNRSNTWWPCHTGPLRSGWHPSASIFPSQ
jgi:hypothetical protein